MSHALADYRNWYVLAFGDACPRVPAHVHGKRRDNAAQPGNFFQVLVDAEQRTFVLGAEFFGRQFQDREQVITGTSCGIFRHGFLHAAFPPDVELLSGLVPAVTQYAVLQVGFLQISHVDERHATGVKRKEEHILCQFPMRLSRQVKFLDAPDVLQGYGAFHGLVHSRIDMPEGMFLYGQPLFHSTVVGGAQDKVYI